MKKIFLVILMVLGTMMTTHAQQWSDYRVHLRTGYSFGNEQHHFSTGSLVSTNHPNVFIFLDDHGISREVLVPRESVIYQDMRYDAYIYHAVPYANGSAGYWYVITDRGNYIVSKYGRWSSTSVRYYGDDDNGGFYYDIPVGGRTLLYYDWHLCSSHRRSYYHSYYHDRYYHRSKVYHRPNYRPVYHRPTPPKSYRGVNNSYRDYRDVKQSSPDYRDDRYYDRHDYRRDPRSNDSRVSPSRGSSSTRSSNSSRSSSGVNSSSRR